MDKSNYEIVLEHFCSCETQSKFEFDWGTCYGCLISKRVQEHFGTRGIQFLAEKLREVKHATAIQSIQKGE